MKWLLISLTLLGWSYAMEAHAAAQSTAPYSTGRLCWTWQKGAPPMSVQADHLNVRCGTAPGVRDFPVKPIPFPQPPPDPPEYCIAIKDVIPTPPTFPVSRYCAATGAAGTSESKESVEFFFVVTGPEIAAPTNPRLVP